MPFNTQTYIRIALLFAFLVALENSSFAVVNPGDDYEVDDSFGEATIITPNDKNSQHHTIHNADDEDWVRFYALQDKSYEIRAFNQSDGMDAIIQLYKSDGQTLEAQFNNPQEVTDESLVWTCSTEGIYYVRIDYSEIHQAFSGEPAYDLQIRDYFLFELPEYITGIVQSKGGKSISNAIIKMIGSEDSGAAISQGDGSFIASMRAGSYNISVNAVGYQSAAGSGVTVPGDVSIVLNTIPIAIGDQIETTRGGTVTGNVLKNDFDEDGDVLTAIIGSGVVHGTLSMERNGQFTYTHNGGIARQDSFIYYANDGRVSSNAVTVNVSVGQVYLPFLMLLLKN